MGSEVLVENGITHDSSIFPVSIPRAPELKNLNPSQSKSG